jgi:cyclopropane fatty-acyl-phospholipid synthase-like methyltransferase
MSVSDFRELDFRESFDQPWYHDFTPLGVPTPQPAGILGPNQLSKQDILFDYIKRAIALSGPDPRGLEMFCADGFFSHYALQHGAAHMTGVDLGEPMAAGSPVHLLQAAAMAEQLGHQDRAVFRKQDVYDVEEDYDFVICAGGLYHLPDPASLLRKIHDNARSALVLQTVYSMTTDSPDYFEAPAPNWTWGCRFSNAWLLRTLAESGWKVVDSAVNELTGNPQPKDRGSAYALCVPA